ncbi:MotA/TolQ/ExbB proton channel family protein [Bacteroidota bacterium]
MKNWFIMGGYQFMSVLTILFVIIVAVSVWYAISIANGRALEKVNFKHQLKYLKSIGLFTMIVGILGNFIGLLGAFSAIEQANNISPAIMAGGLKVSMITTLTGILFYLISIILWFILDLWYHKKLITKD